MFGIVKRNIWSVLSNPLPLKQSRLTGQITNLFAKLTLSQQFYTTTDVNDVTFYFPLHELGTLCGFEATVGGNKTVTTTTKIYKTKELPKDAKKLAKENTAMDFTALLMCYLEKLPARTQLEVRVTFVAEPIFYSDSSLCFVIPTTICPRIYSHEVKSPSSVSYVNEYQFALDLDISTSRRFAFLEAVSSPTHPIKYTVTNGVGNVTLNEKIMEPLTDADLVLILHFQKSFDELLPHAFIEKYDEIKPMVTRTALALAFQLDYDNLIVNEKGPSEVIIAVDCALPAKYFVLIQHAVKSAIDELTTLREIKVNFVLLAAQLLPLFSQSVPLTEDIVIKMREYVDSGKFEKDFHSGYRDLFTGLNEFYSIYSPDSTREDDDVKQIILVTSGQISRSSSLLEVVSANANFFTLLPLGIGIEANIPLLTEVARMSYGYAEFEMSQDRLQVALKAKKQIRRACQAILDDLVMDWGDLQDCIIQAPERLPIVFSRNCIIFYAFLDSEPDDRQFKVTLKGVYGEKSPMTKKIHIDLDNNDVMKGNIIHILAATERIFDLEERSEEIEAEEELQGTLSPKKYGYLEERELIASNYEFVSKQTSFYVSQKIVTADISNNKGNADSSLDDSFKIVLLASEADCYDFDGEEFEEMNAETSTQLKSHEKHIYPTDFLLQYKDRCTDKPKNSNIELVYEEINEKKRNISRSPKSKKRPPERKRAATPTVSPAKKKVHVKAVWEKDNSRIETPKHELIYKQITSLLNKITKENFDSVKNQIVELGNEITNSEILRGVISLVFEKAVNEPKFAAIYSDLCVFLAEKFPQFPDPNNSRQKISFKRLLLNKCQQVFEKQTTVEDKNTTLTPEELQNKARQRTIGNIIFVGELYKNGLLRPDIIHSCITVLLGTESHSIIENMKFSDTEKIELLVKLLRTAGQKLDSQPQDKVSLDRYFARLQQLSVDKHRFESRIRFLIMELIDLRKNNWHLRPAQREEEQSPKTIDDLQHEGKREERAKPREPFRETEGQKIRQQSSVWEVHGSRAPKSRKQPDREDRNLPRIVGRGGGNYHDIRKSGEQKYTTNESLGRGSIEEKRKGGKKRK
jgi:hypothetical protein